MALGLGFGLKLGRFAGGGAAPAPVVTSMTSPSGDWREGAQTRQVNGSNFTAGMTAKVDGAAVACTYVSPTRIDVAIPNTVHWWAGNKTVSLHSADGLTDYGSQAYAVVYGANVRNFWLPALGKTFSSGALVQNWAGQVPGADASLIFTQLDTAKQFTYSASVAALNGAPGVVQSGAQQMSTGTIPGGISQPHELAIAVHVASDSSTHRLIADGLAVGARCVIYAVSGSGLAAIIGGASLTSAVSLAAQKRLVMALYNGASSEIRIDKYGTASTTGNAGTHAPTGIRIGTDYAGSLNMGGGAIGELTSIIGAMSATMRQEMALCSQATYGTGATP